ncbi:MAG: S8 family serine peptidase [Oscillatoriophycideae cyanobacterium NC_groundwater_1537_Pr4_S-0.65um_50_18]|nr:S8 family serine peptidase [Oscillatoriophycideae cyanobacterium NC_groundwater_1537_Pr4_S-0.65um_50_18]
MPAFEKLFSSVSLPAIDSSWRGLTEASLSWQRSPHSKIARSVSGHLRRQVASQIGTPLSITDEPPQKPRPRRNSASQRPGQTTQTDIHLRQTLSGALTRSDFYKAQLSSYVDEYRLKRIRAGQIVQVSLKSGVLDAELRLMDARTHKVLLYGADTSRYNASPRLVFTAKAGVQYRVQISTASGNDPLSYGFRSFGKTGSYRLQVEAIASASPDFNFFYGSGLVNAAAAVARAVGQSPFADAVKLGGDRAHLDQIHAAAAWAQGYTGQGVIVAVLDGGVDYNHPDLQQTIWSNPQEIANNGMDDDGNGFVDDVRGWNFTGDNNDPADALSDGHGSHVAGIIASANDGLGSTGVAYSAKIMPIKVIDGENTSDEPVAKGIRYAVQNGAKVINISLGKESSTQPSQALKDALQLAYQSGAIVVMASGNRRQTLGTIQPDNPAAYAAANGLGIAVGATNGSRLFTDSNPAGRKRSAFVVAPGVKIRSTVAGGLYSSYSGTSMATPHVSGVVALMLSANPNLTPTQVAEILADTSDRRLTVTP